MIRDYYRSSILTEYSFVDCENGAIMQLALTFAKSCLFMLAGILCLMPLDTYYAKYYAGIIDSGLVPCSDH